MMNRQLVCSKKALEKTRQEDKMIKRNQWGKDEKGLTEVGVEKGGGRENREGAALMKLSWPLPLFCQHFQIS